MKSEILKGIFLCLIVFSLAACTAKTTETTAVEQETTTQPKRGNQNGQNPAKGEKGKRPQFSDLLAKMDANKDGKLAKSEIQGRLKDDFDKVDTDNDGFITETEFKNMPKPGRGKR